MFLRTARLDRPSRGRNRCSHQRDDRRSGRRGGWRCCLSRRHIRGDWRGWRRRSRSDPRTDSWFIWQPWSVCRLQKLRQSLLARKGLRSDRMGLALFRSDSEAMRSAVPALQYSLSYNYLSLTCHCPSGVVQFLKGEEKICRFTMIVTPI